MKLPQPCRTDHWKISCCAQISRNGANNQKGSLITTHYQKFKNKTNLSGELPAPLVDAAKGPLSDQLQHVVVLHTAAVSEKIEKCGKITLQRGAHNNQVSKPS